MDCVLGWDASEELVQAASNALQAEWPRGSKTDFYRDLIASGSAEEQEVAAVAESQQDEEELSSSSSLELTKLSQASFVFYRRTDGAFIGHLRASIAIVAPTSAIRAVVFTFVIVDRSLRSNGWGTAIMREIEQRAKRIADYACLWTTTAVGFYKTIGYHECAPVSIHRECFSGLGKHGVGLLEGMLRRHLSDREQEKDDKSSATMMPEVKTSDVWLRKRLNDWNEDGFQILLPHYPMGDGDAVFLKDFRLLRQVGPSCGMVAIRMVSHYLRDESLPSSSSLSSSSPEEEALLRRAIVDEGSIDGECFDLSVMVRLCERLPGISACIVQFSDITIETIVAGITSETTPHAYIIPYDHHSGTNAPYLNNGNSSHFGCIVGVDRATDECWVVHGMSSEFCIARLELFRKSNAQLERVDERFGEKQTRNKLQGVALLVCKSS